MFRRTIRIFLWKLIHGGFKVGDYWKGAGDLEDRTKCPKCDVVESMDHIITNCEARGQEQVWNLANELWKRKTGEEEGIRPTIGRIMAIGLLSGET